MCDKCAWQDLADQIDEVLDDQPDHWAQETLEGIQTWVQDNRHATDRQKQAIKNILKADTKKFKGKEKKDEVGKDS